MHNIIAFDLDGTLAESKQAITHEMAEALYSLSLRKKIIIISGGSYEQFTKQLIPSLINAAKASASAKGLEHIVLMPVNGSRRYEHDIDMGVWKETHVYPFNNEIKHQVVLKLNEIIAGNYDVPRTHYGEYVEDRMTQITFSALGQEAPIEEKRTWDPDQKKRLRIKAELERSVPGIEVNIGGMTSIDILPKGFNKAVGLLRYASERKIPIDDILFIGDAVFEGGNDYSPKQAGIETKKVGNTTETLHIIESLV